MEAKEIVFNSSKSFSTPKRLVFAVNGIPEKIEQKGKSLKGNDEYIENHTNYWTFSKDLKSSNPNWKLVVTKAE